VEDAAASTCRTVVEAESAPGCHRRCTLVDSVWMFQTSGPWIMKCAKTVIFNFLAFLISTVLTIAALLLSLKLFDVYLLSHRHAALADEDDDEATMRTLEYYPFTGGQIQAYKREHGKLPWSNFYDDFDVASGEYGFFIDFRLEAPPPKQDNEIRIVLTGGSAAQGWGARTNADMFYQLLPAKLNQELREHGQNCKVTVVNLAMGGSHIYQNFIALNKWVHPLQPDAIISFSGHNELAIPETTRSDADELAIRGGGLLYVLRYSASPRWLKMIAQYYPGIVKRTVVGSLIRLMYLPDYSNDWEANYLLSRIDPNFGPMPREELQRRYQAAITSLSMDETIESVSIPLYENSLESISRDFPGTPVFAVFQPLNQSPEVYTRMTTVVPSKVNDQDHYADVKFLNLHRVWEEHNYFPGSLVDSVHLSNDGHKLVTTYLSDWLLPFAQDRCAQLNTTNAASPQHVN
jgi:lysophospholipase L1-like esterase